MVTENHWNSKAEESHAQSNCLASICLVTPVFAWWTFVYWWLLARQMLVKQKLSKPTAVVKGMAGPDSGCDLLYIISRNWRIPLQCQKGQLTWKCKLINSFNAIFLSFIALNLVFYQLSAASAILESSCKEGNLSQINEEQHGHWASEKLQKKV